MRNFVVVLFCLMALVGCGNSGQEFAAAPGGSSAGLSLQVQADPAALSRGVLSRFSSETATLRVSLFDSNLNLLETQEGTPQETFTFQGLSPGQYLVRTVGLDAGGNILGFFDRVVELSGSGLTAVIPGLRPTASPPTVAFPANDAPPYFLFEELPERVQPGQNFAVTLQLFTPQGVRLEQSVDQVSLTASGLNLTQNPQPGQTDTAGLIAFSNLRFVEGTEGLARLQVEATGVEQGLSDQIRVVIAVPDPVVDPDEVLSMSFDDVPLEGVEGEQLDTIVVKVVNGQGQPPEQEVDVMLSLNNPGGAVLSGILTESTVGGFAAFDDLTIDQPGQFTLRATILESPDDPPMNVPPANSPTITINEAPSLKLQFRAVPNEVLKDQPILPITIDLFDEQGFPFDQVAEVRLSLAPASQGPGSLVGTVVRDSSVNGNVSFTSVSIDEPGDYVLRAESDDFRGAVSTTITVGVPTQFFQTIKLVTKTIDGQGLNERPFLDSISGDGKLVGFTSESSNLIPDDTNGAGDGFIFDSETGQTERVTVGSGGDEGNIGSGSVQLSDDGNKVAFVSGATNFALLTTTNVSNVFLRDRQAGTTDLISQVNGESAEFSCLDPRISGDGSTISFLLTRATVTFFPELDGIFIPGFRQVVRTTGGQLELITVNADGEPGRQLTQNHSISDDGSKLAIFGPDNMIALGNGQFGNGPSLFFDGTFTETIILPDTFAQRPVISGDGQLVAYETRLGNSSQVFVTSPGSGTSELVSRTPNGQPGNNGAFQSALSRDGRFVVYVSAASDLVPNDTNNLNDIFVTDRNTGEVRRVSVDFEGNQVFPSQFLIGRPRISADGKFIAFQALGTFVPNEPGGVDIYVVENPFTFQAP